MKTSSPTRATNTDERSRPAYYDRWCQDFGKFVLLREREEGGDFQSRNEIEWLAHHGSGIAIIYVANAYRIGFGCSQDLAKAKAWYGYGSRGGLPHGEHGLGLLAKSAGDYSAAAEHFRSAVSQDFAPAINQLGLLYYKGRGVPRDPLKARELWLRGARLGNVWCQKYLAHKAMSGEYGLLWIAIGAWMLVKATAEILDVLRDPYNEKFRGDNFYEDCAPGGEPHRRA